MKVIKCFSSHSNHSFYLVTHFICITPVYMQKDAAIRAYTHNCTYLITAKPSYTCYHRCPQANRPPHPPARQRPSHRQPRAPQQQQQYSGPPTRPYASCGEYAEAGRARPSRPSGRGRRRTSGPSPTPCVRRQSIAGPRRRASPGSGGGRGRRARTRGPRTAGRRWSCRPRRVAGRRG